MIALSARVFTSFVIIVALIALADHFAGTVASDRDDPGFYRDDEHGFSIRGSQVQALPGVPNYRRT